MSRTTKTLQSLVFAYSAFVGWFIWFASFYFTGHREPWDSESFYYRDCLLVGGAIAGFLLPRRFWLWAVGMWVGQMIGFIQCMAETSRPGSLAPFGFLVLLPIYSIWGMFGAGAGAGTRWLCHWIATRIWTCHGTRANSRSSPPDSAK